MNTKKCAITKSRKLRQTITPAEVKQPVAFTVGEFSQKRRFLRMIYKISTKQQ